MIGEGLEGPVGGVWMGRPEKLVLGEGIDGPGHGIAYALEGGDDGADVGEVLSE
jgi:hypothetical protein